MPEGFSKKREREFEELVGEFKKEDRYKGREEEVAARIVNKQRAQQGETKEEKEKDRKGESPDRNLPIERYDQLTVDEVSNRLGRLSKTEIQKVRTYENKHRGRKTLLDELDRALEEEEGE